MLGNNTGKLPVYLSLLKLAKMSSFSFYLLCFSSTKSENRKEEQVMGLGDWHWWEMGHGRERCEEMNTVKIIYKHVCKCKNETC
jgi:hypothetical protein